ncbi:hypothetical protein DOZ91_19765 [Peribacillus frigoritolerans]|nr:hypothetical protein DOZ91_19765 [Peribacillus frigoritolerans]
MHTKVAEGIQITNASPQQSKDITSSKTFELISEIRSLSADCLPSLLGTSACGVLASQFFGRSVAYFFHPIRSTEKKLKG